MGRFLSCFAAVLLIMLGGQLTFATQAPVRLCTGGGWSQVPGTLKHVSIGEGGVWGVSGLDDIYYRNGSYGDETQVGDKWVKIFGKLKQLDVGSNILWGVNKYSEIYYRAGIDANTPSGTSWVRVHGVANHISVSQKGHVWVINTQSKIYHRVGASNANPAGDAWKRVSNHLFTQISVGSGGVWGVSGNFDGKIYYRHGSYGDPDSDPDGPSWITVPGKLKYVSSSDMIYGINADDEVRYRQGVSASEPTGTAWIVTIGHLKQVEFLSLVAWGAGEDLRIWVKQRDALPN